MAKKNKIHLITETLIHTTSPLLQSVGKDLIITKKKKDFLWDFNNA